MTFEERLKLKQRSGFDDKVKFKEEILQRKEQAEKLKNKPKDQKMKKKMPKERYSKLPVSILRPLNLNDNQPKALRRDPRFDNQSGRLNEGLFRESYAFVKEIRNERIQELKGFI